MNCPKSLHRRLPARRRSSSRCFAIQSRALAVLVAALLAVSFFSTSQALAQSDDEAEVGPTHDQLLQLVAPIALYPDALVAQILAAATYPTQIVEAARFIQNNPGLSGAALVNAVNQQPWDPSVMALTQFPSVLDNMNRNLSWTSSLGDAYYNAPQEVLQAIQELRLRAQQAGTLKTTPQQIVTTDNGTQTIIIQPAQPSVVYVPTYNPTVVYGAPVPAYPGYTTGEMVATAAVSFGVGMLVGSAISNSSWGWNSWGCNWRGGNVVYQNNVFVSRSNVFAGGRGYWGGYRNPNYHRPPGWNGNANRPGGWNSGYKRPSTLPANRPVNVNRPANINNVNRTNNNANRINANRTNVNRPSGQQLASREPAKSFTPMKASKGANQNFQNFRGFGQSGSGSRGAGAFGGFDAGGNARMASDRGRASLGSGNFGKGGGGLGGGRAGGFQGGRGGRLRR